MPAHRIPKQLKVVRGTFRKDRNPKNELEGEPVREVPKPPTGLNRWGRKLWKRIAQQLVDNGVLTELDLPALEQLCQQYGRAQELYDAMTHEIDETGKRRKRSLAEYLVGRNSQTMPEYQVMRQAENLLKAYLEQFGLTPASRNRIDLSHAQEEKQDPMEALLNEA
jgi:P27 family predicted phage terminase small subunit